MVAVKPPSGDNLKVIFEHNTYIDNGKFDLARFREQIHSGATDRLVPGKNGRPTGLHVFKRVNRYEPQRVHLAVYNWDHLDRVRIDLEGVLARGQAYRVVNVLDFFGAPWPKARPKAPRSYCPCEGIGMSRNSGHTCYSAAMETEGMGDAGYFEGDPIVNALLLTSGSLRHTMRAVRSREPRPIGSRSMSADNQHRWQDCPARSGDRREFLKAAAAIPAALSDRGRSALTRQPARPEAATPRPCRRSRWASTRSRG